MSIDEIDDVERASCMVSLLVLLGGAVLGWLIVGAFIWFVIQWLAS